MPAGISLVNQDRFFSTTVLLIRIDAEMLMSPPPINPNRFGNPKFSFDNDKEITFDENSIEIPSYLSDTPEVRAELAQYYQSVARLDRGIEKLIDILKSENKYDNTLILYLSDNGSAFPESKTNLYDPGLNLPLIVKPPCSQDIERIQNAMPHISWADITPTLLQYAGVDYNPEDFHGISFRDILGEKDRKLA